MWEWTVAEGALYNKPTSSEDKDKLSRMIDYEQCQPQSRQDLYNRVFRELHCQKLEGLANKNSAIGQALRIAIIGGSLAADEVWSSKSDNWLRGLRVIGEQRWPIVASFNHEDGAG